jgi:hypothetical protein
MSHNGHLHCIVLAGSEGIRLIPETFWARRRFPVAFFSGLKPQIFNAPPLGAG